MQKPIIELKSIEFYKKLTDETPAYSAKLYVDGKHFANVSNTGKGSDDMVLPPNGEPSNEFNEKFIKLNQAIAETYPKLPLEIGKRKYEFDQSLETVCHGLVWDYEENRASTRSRQVAKLACALNSKKSDSLANGAAEQGYDIKNIDISTN